MTSIDSKSQAVPTGSLPTLIVVDDHDVTRKTVANSLRRRFGLDYEVIEFESPAAAQKKLERLHSAGADVAVIAANGQLAGQAGISFLAKTRDVYPTARRLVLANWGDVWVMPSIARASTLGEIDHFDYHPASETDERFLAGVGEILADWARENARGDARITIVGHRGDPTFQLLSEVLQRWDTEPISTLEAGTPEGDRFLDERGISGPAPIVAVSDGRVVTGANIAKLSDAAGAGTDPRSATYDVVIVGLGPAGYSAAVNAASEGLRVILIEPSFGQASSSPLIRNYLGFPAGVSGAELMRRAWMQALMFGAVARIGRTATSIRRQGRRNVVLLDDGSEVTADAVMLAIGVDYRRIGVSSVDRLVGRGVFYGYGALDAHAMTGVDVAVVGGANSAVQAAIHLARYARSVRLVVRGGTLADTASEYLIAQLVGLPHLTVHLDSEVVDAGDEQHLRSISLRNRTSGDITEQPVAGLFVMIGAIPRTDWLPSDIARDNQRFVLTGEDGPHVERPEQFRLPYETTMPGVFALGDVRSGSVKRIAAAVGEGSAAVQQVHRYLTRVAEAAGAERERAIGEPMPIGTMHAEIAATSK